MSYFTITCPWCEARYKAGIVGREWIGDHHECPVEKPCDHDGCEESGRLAVSPVSTGPMGWLAGQGYDFCCFDHVNGRTIFMCQPAPTSKTQRED